MKQEILRFENVTCKKDGAVYLDNLTCSHIKAEIVGIPRSLTESIPTISAFI